VVPQQLTVVTRRRLLDALVVEKVRWWGDLDEVSFLERLYDLDALEGDGYRRPTAREDTWQDRTERGKLPPRSA
jgi:AbiJ N-terminal domain 3